MRRSDRKAPGQHRQQGLTLFELVVFILVVAIVFAAGFNRFREYPEAAERASFLATVAQLKAGANLQMMRAIAQGNWNQLSKLEGSNPMDLMLENPHNYVGSFAVVEQSSMPRRVWYFDSSSGDLVYLPDNNENLYELRGSDIRARAEEVRLRLKVVYANDREMEEAETAEVEDVASGGSGAAISSATGDSKSNTSQSWQGLILQPVRHYEWQSSELRPPEG